MFHLTHCLSSLSCRCKNERGLWEHCQYEKWSWKRLFHFTCLEMSINQVIIENYFFLYFIGNFIVCQIQNKSESISHSISQAFSQQTFWLVISDTDKINVSVKQKNQDPETQALTIQSSIIWLFTTVLLLLWHVHVSPWSEALRCRGRETQLCFLWWRFIVTK